MQINKYYNKHASSCCTWIYNTITTNFNPFKWALEGVWAYL